MSKLIEYKCLKCKQSQYVFSGEEEKRLIYKDCEHRFKQMPPNPTVIHATVGFMTDFTLDSIASIYELDRILTLEAAEERETKALNKARVYE